jgi:hypothetical protein
MSDHLIDPEILWSKAMALRDQLKTVKDELLAMSNAPARG